MPALPPDLAGRYPKRRRFGSSAFAIRPLALDDASRLIAFFESHAPETIHQRYGYLLTHMSPERAAELVGVDQTRDVALGLFSGSGPRQTLHAVARYCLLEDGTGAEAAFVVRETLRGRGIASALLDELREIAANRGLAHLTAQVQRANAPMLSVFARYPLSKQAVPGTDSVELDMPLTPSTKTHPRRGSKR